MSIPPKNHYTTKENHFINLSTLIIINIQYYKNKNKEYFAKQQFIDKHNHLIYS